jgi:acyl carrier protein
VSGGQVMDDQITDAVRAVLRDHGRLPVDIESIGVDADLFAAGMSSHASVSVMLALEDSFDIEFPDAMLKRSVFETISSIDAAVREIRAEAA